MSSTITFFITDGPCPAGYDLELADRVGAGFEYHYIESVEECSNFCTANKDCCSIEYSPTRLQCNLHKECLPDSQVPYQDYMSCKKSKFNYIYVCFMTSQSANLQSAMSSLKTIYCTLLNNTYLLGLDLYSMTISRTFKSVTNSGTFENSTIFFCLKLPKSSRNAKIINAY